MSTIVTFAGQLAEDFELLHTRDEKPFVGCRFSVHNRVLVAGDWVDDEPTAHQVEVCRRAATNLYDYAGRGDRLLVHGHIKTETSSDRVTGAKRRKQVGEVSNGFEDVGASLTFTAARLQRTQRATAAHWPPEATSPTVGATGAPVGAGTGANVASSAD